MKINPVVKVQKVGRKWHATIEHPVKQRGIRFVFESHDSAVSWITKPAIVESSMDQMETNPVWVPGPCNAPWIQRYEPSAA